MPVGRVAAEAILKEEARALPGAVRPAETILEEDASALASALPAAGVVTWDSELEGTAPLISWPGVCEHDEGSRRSAQ